MFLLICMPKLLQDRSMLRRMIVLFLAIADVVAPSIQPKIYNSLTHCYRGNNTSLGAGSTLPTLLELIRKVEDAYPTSIDMRMLVVSILHQLRVDGIQKAFGVQETELTIPYGVNEMMGVRFQLLLNLVPNTPNPINFTEILTPSEMCLFHHLVSSTVEPLVRGNELKTCSPNVNSKQQGQNVQCISNKVQTLPNGKVLVTPGDISSCPEEYGVIRTFDYGSFSPGVIIGSVAASLQPEMIQIRDILTLVKDTDTNLQSNTFQNPVLKDTELNNNHVAGIIGNLAEVCIYQSPYYGDNVTVGLSGYWDDMNFPKKRYLISADHYNKWQLTDSEILAGIDSYHLSIFTKSWVDHIKTLRLSQLLEMYYSPRGVPTTVIDNMHIPLKHALTMGQLLDAGDSNANLKYRKSGNIRSENYGSSYYDSYFDGHNIEDSLDSACDRRKILERMSSRILKEETFKLAQVMKLFIPIVEVDDDLLYSACNSAVDRFFTYAKTLLQRIPDCRSISSNYRRANVELTLVVDGSRDAQQTDKLIGALCEMVDVSKFGSYISVIHGGTGDTLVTRTNKVLHAFEELRDFTGPYSSSLSLSNSLSKVVQLFSAQDSLWNENPTISQRSRVVLVISQNQKITDDDFKNAKWLVSGSMKQFIDAHYIFVTNDANTIQDLFKEDIDKGKPTNTYIIESSDLEPKTFLPKVDKILRQIPKRLTGFSCDYVAKSNSAGNWTSNRFEDYVSPNQANTYLIHSSYLQSVSRLQVQFEGVGYGSFTACMIQSSSTCQSTAISEVIQFNVTSTSHLPSNSSGVVFTVELDSSNMRCTENDCRYPDQVRYYISVENEECRTGGIGYYSNSSLLIMISLALSLLNVFYLF